MRARWLTAGRVVLLVGVAYGVMATAAVATFATLWRNELNDRTRLERTLDRARLDLAGAAGRAKEAQRREWRDGFRHGEAVGRDSVFETFRDPWQEGTWYLVKTEEDSRGRLRFDARYDVEPNSGTALAVENGRVYNYDVGSSSSNGAAAESVCNLGGVIATQLGRVSCADAARVYREYLAGATPSPWRCYGSAGSGSCSYFSAGAGDESAGFRWR